MRKTCAGQVAQTMFDERDLGVMSSPEFPGERLIVCRQVLATPATRASGAVRRRSKTVDLTVGPDLPHRRVVAGRTTAKEARASEEAPPRTVETARDVADNLPALTPGIKPTTTIRSSGGTIRQRRSIVPPDAPGPRRSGLVWPPRSIPAAGRCPERRIPLWSVSTDTE